MKAAFLLLLLTAGVPAQNANVAVPGVERTPEPANSTVRASVFYEDTGRPVRRMSVMLLASEGRGGELAGVTDNNGVLVLRGVRAGRYYAIVNAPGVVTPLAYVDVLGGRPDNLAEQFAEFPAIVVNGISDVEVQIPARRGGAIGGRVMYENGDPAIGVRVEVLRKVGESYVAPMANMSAIPMMMMGGVGTYQTDDRGAYRVAGLPEGEYIVKVTENVVHNKASRSDIDTGFETLFLGTASMVNVFFENAFDRGEAKTLTVGFGQELAEINITLPDRSLFTLEGKAVAAKDKLPIRNAQVSIKRESDVAVSPALERYMRRQQTVQTDDKGGWSFSELPRGRYVVMIDAENAEFDAKEKAYGRSPAMAANYAANYVANAANAISNTSSYYDMPRRSEGPPAPKFAKKTAEFTLADENLIDQVVELSFGATVIGEVSFEGTDTDPDGMVAITASAEGKHDSTVSTNVSFYDYDDDGKPRRQSKRTFRLQAIGAGPTIFSLIAGDPDYYVKSAASNQIDLLKGPVDIKAGETYANVRIVLSNETGTLKGMVIDEDKQPVPGVEIAFVPTDPVRNRTSTHYRSARTGDNGEFTLRMPPFEYAVIKMPAGSARRNTADFYTWLATAIKQAQTFKIESGQTAKITIKRDKRPVAR